MPTRLSKALRSLTREEGNMVQKASRGSLGSYVLNAPHEYGQPRPEIGDSYGLISPERMREIVQKTPTPAACVNATIDFAIGVPLTIRSTNPAQKPDQGKVTYLTSLLTRPNPNDTRPQFLRQIYKDVVTIGWAAVEIESDANGNIANLWPLDAAKLYVDFDEHGAVLGYDMMDASGFPIHSPKDAEHGWLPDEIIFFRLDPQTNSRYPSSRIQQIFPAAVVENLILAFTGQRFTDTNIPYGVFDLGDLTPDEVKKSVAAWDAQARTNHRILITGSKGNSKWFPFSYSMKELEAKELIGEVKAYMMGVMGVTENELGESQSVNKSNGYNLSYTFKKRAIEPLLQEITASLTARIVVDRLAWDDVEYSYAEIDSRDELLQAQIDDAYVKMGGETINSVLNRRGMPSVKGGDIPMFFTGTAFIPVEDLAAYSKAQLKVLQMASMVQPGATGPGIQSTPPKPAGSLEAPESFPDNDTKGKSAPRVSIKSPKPAQQKTQSSAKGPHQSQSRGLKDAGKRAGVTQ